MDEEKAQVYSDLKTRWVSGELSDQQYLMSVYALENNIVDNSNVDNSNEE
jgi:hypothetical protein